MSKLNQRKEIIDQIKDLSSSPKRVNISNIETHGHSLAVPDSHSLPDATAIAKDLLLDWETYYFFPSDTPTHINKALFTNLSASDSVNVYTGTLMGFNGFTDPSCSYGKAIRYIAAVKARDTIRLPIAISGKCRASVYINNIRVLLLSYNPSSGTPTSAFINFDFVKDHKYVIDIIVYCNHQQDSAYTFLFESPLFKYCDIDLLPEIASPINLYASSDVPTQINLSWLNSSVNNLDGGGTELWFKNEQEIGSEYSLLERVDYPVSSHTHESLSMTNILNDNADMGAFVLAPDSTTSNVGNRVIGDTTGLLRWEVYISTSLLSAVWTSSGLEGFDTMLSIKNDLPESIPFTILKENSVTDSSVLIVAPPFILTYDGTNNFRTLTPEVTTTSNDSTVVLSWICSDTLPDSTFNVTLYDDTSDTLYTPSASEGFLSIALSSAQVSAWRADPDNLQINVETSDAFLSGGDTTDDYIGITSLRIVEGYGNDSGTVVLTTDYLPVAGLNSCSTDIIMDNVEHAITQTILYMYDSDKNHIGAIPVAFAPSDSVIFGEWNRYTTTYDLLPNVVYCKYQYILGIPIDSGEQTVNIQQIALVSNNNISIPANTSFSYKARNFTHNFRFSSFTDEIIGATPPEIYYMTMDIEQDVVSPFRDAPVVIRATTPLQSLNVWTEAEGGYNPYPMYEIAQNSNNIDFTYLFKPILNKAVIYDTFDYDYRLETEQETPFVIEDGYKSAEESPARAPAEWYTTNSSIVVYHTDDGQYSPIWTENVPNSDNFKSVLGFISFIAGNYKKYNIRNTDSFYQNLYGSVDDPNGYYLHNDNDNAYKMSIGLIFKVIHWGMIPGEYQLVCRGLPDVFRVYIMDHPPYGKHIAVTAKTEAFVGDTFGAIVFRHSLPEENSWFYLHTSIDTNNLYDTNLTYTSLHRVVGVEDHTIVNEISDYPIFEEGADSRIRWRNLEDIQLGQIRDPLNTGSTFAFAVDMFYLTCDTVTKDIINTLAPYVATSKNPYFTNFGYKSGQDIIIRASGVTSSNVNSDVVRGSIILDADTLSTETSIKSDFDEPDGTVNIMRDNYIYSQNDIDNASASQPLVTYTLYNRMLPNFVAERSIIDKIRFSNDKITWGSWLPYNHQMMYPWQLMTLGDDSSDTEEIGDRTVWGQVITNAGISSDYILEEHSDSILYNPLASVGQINSWNYIEGVDGWNIDLTGNAEFNNIRIRRNVSVGGRIFSSIKASESEINSQSGYGSESLEGPVYYRSLLTAYNNAGIRSIPESTLDATYCWLFNTAAVDTNNLGVIYLAANIGTGSTIGIGKYKYNDIEGDIEETIFSLCSFSRSNLSPQICLSKNYVFVAYNNILYKLNKELTEIISHIASSGYSVVSSLKGAYSANGDFRLYSAQLFEDGYKCGAIYTEDLSLIMSVPIGNEFFQGYYLDDTNYDIYPFHTFDCDGKKAVFIDSRGGVLQCTLDDDGLYTIPEIEYTTVDHYVHYSYWGAMTNIRNGIINNNEYLDYYMRPNTARTPSSIKLFGSCALVWTSPLTKFEENGPHLAGSCVYISMLDFDSGGASETPGTSYLFPSVQDLEAESPAVYNTVSRILRGDILSGLYQIGAPLYSFRHPVVSFDVDSAKDLFGAPPFWFYQTGEHSATAQGGFSKDGYDVIGFGVPTYCNGSIIIPFSNAENNVNYPAGTSLLEFKITGRGLLYKGILYSNSSEKIVQSFYDGNMFWNIGITRQDDNALFISREMA